MGSPEEVKIIFRTEAQGNGAEQTEQKINRVKRAGKSAPQRLTDADLDKFADKPKPDKAEATRRNRALVADAEQDLAHARASGAAPTVITQRENELRTQKLKSRFMREQGIGEEEALEKAGNLVTSQTAAKARTAEEKAATKNRVDGEKAATKEIREQETTLKRIGKGTVNLGQSLMSGGGIAGSMGTLGMLLGGTGVGAAALGGGMLIQEITKDYMERQGIALRDKAARAGDKRDIDIRSGWRGTSTDAQSAYFATEQSIFDRQAQRELILQRNKRAWYNPLRYIDGETTWAGRREADENERGLARDLERSPKEKEQAERKFREEEGGMMLDALRQRSKRTIAGQRAAIMDEELQQFTTTFRKFAAMNGSPEGLNNAAEAGRLTVQNSLRDRQAHAASGLVDARSGAADIAAVASWAGMTVPSYEDLKDAIDTQTEVMKSQHEQDQEARTRKPFGDQ